MSYFLFLGAMISKAYRCTATKLQRRGNNVSVAETNTKATVCTLGGLQSGAEYLLAVRAINSVSRSAAAELTIVMLGGGQLVMQIYSASTYNRVHPNLWP